MYVSIVGMERLPRSQRAPFSYYRHKLEAERLVPASGLPFTVARLTQFHTLINATLAFVARFPVPMVPLRAKYQPIDEREAAGLVAPLVGREPLNGFVEFGGPQVRTLADLGEAWLRARTIDKRFRNLPMPGTGGLAGGVLCTDDRSGTITWEEWLALHAGEGPA